MSVSERFRGVWQRTGLILDGERVVDTRDVLWLQADSYFGDIRVPLPGGSPSADPRLVEFLEHSIFWGRDVCVGEATISWYVEEPMGTEVGTFAYRWEDNVLVESGRSTVAGLSYTWEEEWTCLTGSDAPVDVSEDERGMRLRIGRFDLRVDTSSGRPVGELWERRQGRWSVRAAVR